MNKFLQDRLCNEKTSSCVECYKCSGHNSTFSHRINMKNHLKQPLYVQSKLINLLCLLKSFFVNILPNIREFIDSFSHESPKNFTLINELYIHYPLCSIPHDKRYI